MDGLVPESVVSPRDFEEIARELSVMSRDNISVIPWGGGTRMKVGNIPRRYTVALNTQTLPKGIEHITADMVCVVPAGMSFGEVSAELGREGQRLAFTAPCESTMGGALASNMPGSLRGKFGGIRDSVIGMKVAIADGKIVKSGGKVVKNVQGFDMHRLHTGAFGSLGVIVEAAFKLVPIPEVRKVITVSLDNGKTAWELASASSVGGFMPETLEVFENTENEETVVSVRLTGSDRVVSAMVENLQEAVRGDSAAVIKDAAEVEMETRPEEGDKRKPDVVVRSSLLSNSMKRFTENLKQFVSGNSGASLYACSDALFGSTAVKLYCNDETFQRMFVRKCFETTKTLRGTSIIEECPLSLKEEIDIFGDIPSSIGLMRNLKTRFDPMSILNDGRFIGRI